MKKTFNKKLAMLALSGVMATSLIGAVGTLTMRDMLSPNHSITAYAEEANYSYNEGTKTLTLTGTGELTSDFVRVSKSI